MEEQNAIAPALYERGNAKSLIPFIPLDFNVILRMTHTNSLLGIRALIEKNYKFKHFDATDVTYTVVGVGDRVDTLKIGDKVLVQSQPEFVIKVEDDPNSIISIEKELEKLTRAEQEELVRKGTRWQVNDYGLFPAGNINVVCLK